MNYKPSPTAEAFHKSTAFMRVLEGPIGGGSTTICMQEIIRQCKEMPLSIGKRRSRWVILSPSFHHRRDSALRTFDSLAIDGLTSGFSNDHTRICNFGQDDVTAEIIFGTSDEPQKYNNLEFTGAFICDLNLHRERDMDAIDSVLGRVGRFPRMADCSEYQYGIIADRAYQQVEDRFDEHGEIHMMPPALSVGAENTENLPGGYYHNLLLGKSHEWACRHLLGYPMKIKAEIKR